MQIKLLFSKNVFLAVKPFSALKESFREGYGKQKLIKDIIAGLTVGVIAIPLSMALAIAAVFRHNTVFILLSWLVS